MKRPQRSTHVPAPNMGTDPTHPMWIATAAQSKEIDRRATSDFGIPARVLMERAGLAVFQAIQEMLPKGSITIFCGKGNNGGDGFVVGRLAHEAGFDVECLVTADSFELSPDAAEQYSLARAQGLAIVFRSDARWARRAECLGRRDLIIDAVLGTGARGHVEGAALEAIRCMNHSGVPVVSIDVPSGIDTDTGEELGDAVWALRTVTMGLPKPFLFQGAGLEKSGYWSVAEIGFPSSLLSEPREAHLVQREWVCDHIPERFRGSYKGSNGSLLIVAGSAEMPGAATLTAKAALRSGCGLVTVACIPEVKRLVAAHLPEVTFLTLPERNGAIAAESAKLILERESRSSAAVFGPGLSHEACVCEALDEVWRSWTKPCVVDADALNAVSMGLNLPNAPTVMTPHAGELSRLLRMSVAETVSDRFRAVREAVKTYQQVLIAKGPYSVTGSPNEPMIVNDTGNPGMASAGMGDVLAGIVGTLLAQELPPREAAACGAYWHGAAGDLCAQQMGQIGFTAMDVVERLPQARSELTDPRERKPGLVRPFT